MAVVTGASSGIGRAVALALAEQGARVALAARSKPELDAVAHEVEERGGQALVVPTDVTDDDQVRALVDATVAAWGRIDLVVANAGEYVQAPIEQVSMTLMQRSVDVNFYGSVRLVLAALPHLVERRSGRIVLVSSMDGRKGLPDDGPYASAKSALAAFGDVARQELRPRGIMVTTVLPGRVDTPMIHHLGVPLISKPIAPERVARALLRAAARNRAEVVVPRFNILLIWVHTVWPRLADLAVRLLRLQGWRRSGGR